MKLTCRSYLSSSIKLDVKLHKFAFGHSEVSNIITWGHFLHHMNNQTTAEWIVIAFQSFSLLFRG